MSLGTGWSTNLWHPASVPRRASTQAVALGVGQRQDGRVPMRPESQRLLDEGRRTVNDRTTPPRRWPWWTIAIPTRLLAASVVLGIVSIVGVSVLTTYDRLTRTTSETPTHTVDYRERQFTYFRSATLDRSLRIVNVTVLVSIGATLTFATMAAYADRRRR